MFTAGTEPDNLEPAIVLQCRMVLGVVRVAMAQSSRGEQKRIEVVQSHSAMIVLLAAFRCWEHGGTSGGVRD